MSRCELIAPGPILGHKDSVSETDGVPGSTPDCVIGFLHDGKCVQWVDCNVFELDLPSLSPKIHSNM